MIKEIHDEMDAYIRFLELSTQMTYDALGILQTRTSKQQNVTTAQTEGLKKGMIAILNIQDAILAFDPTNESAKMAQQSMIKMLPRFGVSIIQDGKAYV